MRRAALLAAMLLGACTAAAQAPPLAGTSWQLVELRPSGAAATRVDDPARYTVAFDAEGNAAFRLDCNRGRGRFTATEQRPGAGRLEFGPIAATRAMCPPGSLDTQLGQQLSGVNGYAIEGETLRLETAGGALVWRKAP